MIKGSQELHDKLVNIVINECKKRNFKNIIHNKFYRLDKYTCGEIDVYCRNKKYVLIFECKCNYSQATRIHAEEQLERAKPLFINHRIFKIMAYYTHNGVGYKWIK